MIQNCDDTADSRHSHMNYDHFNAMDSNVADLSIKHSFYELYSRIITKIAFKITNAIYIYPIESPNFLQIDVQIFWHSIISNG